MSVDRFHYWLLTINAQIEMGDENSKRIIGHTDNLVITTKEHFVNASVLNNSLFMFNRSLVESGLVAEGAVKQMKFTNLSYMGHMSDEEYTRQPDVVPNDNEPQS